jgi:hypothetical protein
MKKPIKSDFSDFKDDSFYKIEILDWERSISNRSPKKANEKGVERPESNSNNTSNNTSFMVGHSVYKPKKGKKLGHHSSYWMDSFFMCSLTDSHNDTTEDVAKQASEDRYREDEAFQKQLVGILEENVLPEPGCVCSIS